MASKNGLTKKRIGTPRFMAPEQIQVGTIASQSADIWAVGVIAHLILARSWPMSDEAFSDLMTGVGVPEVISLRRRTPQIDAHIADLVDSCLDLDPNKRPAASKIVEIISREMERSPRNRNDA
jgi:serine/threonine protein kinase